MRSKLAKIISGVLTGCMVLSGIGFIGPVKEVKAAETRVNLNGVYHAALGVQTSTSKWLERSAYYNSDINKNYGTKYANKMTDSDGDVADGTFNDVEIAGNGTYTVSLTDADFMGETTISQLHVATDIPDKGLNDKISITDVNVTINDTAFASFDTAYYETDKTYYAGGIDFIILNHWRSDLMTVLEAQGIKENNDNGYDIMEAKGGESISVTFTVSGFNYNYGETPSSEADWFETQKQYEVPALGAISKVNGINYEVTKSAKKNGTVTVTGAASEKASYNIPATIKMNTYTFKVTNISASAFSGNKKMKSVKIGKNVTTIEKNAFSGCTKLATINVKNNSALKIVGANAFKNVSKKCVVIAPKAKVKSYKKLFKKLTVQ